ncbi:MAG: hypothetical protein KAW17_02135 [Candidatus Eisenbacteria sp.]|nr:hypothetical protein [Candidatus Eisenbacteria bacterium]
MGWLAGGIGSQSTGGVVVNTSDGARNWTLRLEGVGHIKDLHFVDHNVGWAVGSEGTVLRTLDGGAHWEQIDVHPYRDFSGVYFLDRRRGWVVGHHETILYTADGGSTWVWQREGSEFAVRAVVFLDNLRGWAVASSYSGERGLLLRTLDGGEHWTQHMETPVPIRTLTFGDSMHAWITGTNAIYFTEDGGETWTPGEIDSLITTVTDVGFVNHKEGWAVGYFCRVWETNDGGHTWHYVESFGPGYSLRSFHAIEFSDYYNAWIVGSSGFIGHMTRIPVYEN